MIYRLRRKFIKICMLSFFSVFLVFLIAVFLVSRSRTNRQVDEVVDIISENDGNFPDFEELDFPIDQVSRGNILNQESPFSTRFFTVWFDQDGEITETDTRSVASITQEEAEGYARKAASQNHTRGWIQDYRYKKYASGDGTAVVFVDGAIPLSMSRSFLITCIAVFLAGSLLVLLLVILFSKYAVKPIAESYEKQKRFITDANHELKTPLTLILTNVDIAESEMGQNDWLDDIRSEGERMSALIRRMISLARMDEEKPGLEMESFNLSDAVSDSVSAFRLLAQDRHITLQSSVSPDVFFRGDEAAIRQLLSILLDNAVKYCDTGGMIQVTLKQTGLFRSLPLCGKKRFCRMRRRILLTVDNTYATVGSLKLNLLFDRFYRSDRARTIGEGFGVGLSIAQSITEKHRGQITAQAKDRSTIRFQVKL